MAEMEDTFVVPPETLAQTVGEELVLLHMEQGTYFGLDEVGSRVWALIGQGMSLAEVCEALVNEYEIEQETLEDDLVSLVDDLLENDLIRAGQSDNDR